ncbi:UNVERIFIED_CONTAM: Retrovirus-related Pol polyprotein from transposon.6 [Sesamum radiatum]|uniref:Retrovirus-related Pol polyprotein from transposon.6 n=1 Tax=Sesamum radiatum TaxID=300843 RepID=A0AAW2VN48_SESRA
MSIEEEEESMEEQGEEDIMIFVNALSGNTNFTFKVKGEAYGHEVQILIDGGSTHCFLNEEAAIKLNYHLEQTIPMVDFMVETDACDTGIGAILMQKHIPIANFSKALSPRNQRFSAYEKEFLDILQAVHKWKHYLIGHHFIIKTDHQSLKHILEQKVDNALQQKWISKLLGLDYEVHYKKGKDNIAADALSRRDQGECCHYSDNT